nr:MAG TPA: hypothetical protein [Caudoviricetes sp.]DAY69664.1 MAG TPA: hypothetical protein [Caudoviricetes sp.]
MSYLSISITVFSQFLNLLTLCIIHTKSPPRNLKEIIL